MFVNIIYQSISILLDTVAYQEVGGGGPLEAAIKREQQ